MFEYRPPAFTPAFSRRMSQQAPAAPPSAPAPSGYGGFPGVIETLAVIAISGAAAYVGVTTGMKKGQTKAMRAAGWVGGVGSALIGLLYLGAKANVGMGIPQVRVIVPQGQAA